MIASLVPSVLAEGGVASLMTDKLKYLTPEIAIFVTTCIAMVIGLSPKKAVRDFLPFLAVIGLIVAGVLAYTAGNSESALTGDLMRFFKTLIAAAGIPLVLLMTGTVDRAYESAVARGLPFDSIRSNRGEFYAFTLFSLMGLMLCASADDLIWLFLALELTSLPTYVMVSISSGRARAQEAGIKYFFLGAFGAAVFLYGFALIYGATGTTLIFSSDPTVHTITDAFASEGGMGTIGLLGVVLAIIGICFKIAAVPMHLYTPDVYEGAATSVSAFLAFVPKTAGFIAIILILSAVGWGADGHSLPEAIRLPLWIIAALTMTVGNVLALLQKNIKRVLAYSSVAHSGYMLVGIIAGPGLLGADSVAENGLAAVLFYLLCYGFMNIGTFAVLACLERASGEEIETFDDIRGLRSGNPLLCAVMVLCAASLLGLPPLLGFWGKLFLFTSGISAGEYALVAILGINSAIAAFYYLKLISGPLLDTPGEASEGLRQTPFTPRMIAATVSAVSVIALVPFANTLIGASDTATRGLLGVPSGLEGDDVEGAAIDQPADDTAALIVTPPEDDA